MADGAPAYFARPARRWRRVTNLILGTVPDFPVLQASGRFDTQARYTEA